MFVALAMLLAAPAEFQSMTQCDGKTGLEFKHDPVPGVPLYSGIVTGMSWDEAKRLVPKMVGRSETVELFPGVSVLAQVWFQYAPKRVVNSVHFSGRKIEAPKDELTRRFGKPIDIDGGIASAPGFNDWTSKTMLSRFEVLKWCDGPRVYVLKSDENSFDLILLGPRTDH